MVNFKTGRVKVIPILKAQRLEIERYIKVDGYWGIANCSIYFVLL
jgi:hypothetical protein